MAASKKLSIPALVHELKECGKTRDLERGKAVHESAIKASAGKLHKHVASNLVSMYAKCRSLEDARNVFDNMMDHDVMAWTSLILGYVENGENNVALDMFGLMQREGYIPDAPTFVAALKACMGLWEASVGKSKAVWIHSEAAKMGLHLDTRVASTLVDMYAKWGCMEDARTAFEGTDHRNVVCWNALLFGYAENGEGDIALKLFKRMQLEGCAPNSLTFVAALRASSCSATLDSTKLENGKVVHVLAVQSGRDSDLRVITSLVQMYARCGSPKAASEVFERMKHRDSKAWNALMFGYVENGEGRLALELFARMLAAGSSAANASTFVCALKACILLASGVRVGTRPTNPQEQGMFVHSHVVNSGYSSDLRVNGSLIEMYAKCGQLSDAAIVFEGMKHRDLVAWNSFMFGCVELGENRLALQLFQKMWREGCVPDALSFVAALKSCSSLDEVVEIHFHAMTKGFSLDTFVSSSLVDMYVKYGSIADAQLVFDKASRHDVVMWTALILGYVECGKGEMALDIFFRMKREGCEPDDRCFVAGLKACGMVGALEIGRAMHNDIRRRGLENNPYLLTGLVDFYCKCGNMVEAQQVFHSHFPKDLVAWNALIAGCSRLGNTEGVFYNFSKMQDARLQPNSATFLSVLAACSHAGLIDKGKEYFDSMLPKYGIVPCREHYHCVIDMLSRANKRHEALEVLKSMPYVPNEVSWMTVYSSFVT